MIFTHWLSLFPYSSGDVLESDKTVHPVWNEAISFLMKIVINQLSTSLSICTDNSTRDCIVVDKLCQIHISKVNLLNNNGRAARFG